ncbi:CRISPR-associated endonuclease Cas2 [Bifidobacterium sp. ESL0763]|uniref:CRISPR-associated endonuclease Cas2 n=1 Tax=Bifidobacterium sp. ESL0763 TaxID=2983227 RepID=UPI0023F88FBE|nr:CRISPR-associated endonuclease Cas2 [Bifidobacterium sp. ESL0763]MDF7663614.1 CRISPR-associated endonuclease Cas2 [Bifidobacterium sp. ESL0763]
MSDERRSYLIAYDINNDKRRTHVAKTLQSYGERLQYSVFLVETRPAKMFQLQQELEDLMASGQDSIVICLLGTVDHAHDAMTFLGRERYQDLVVPTVI